MNNLLETLENFASDFEALVWSLPFIIIMVLAGIYFTILTRFVQVRKIKTMVKLLLRKESTNRGVSSFQAFALSVAGRVGTGNIVGVAGAIATGGPGALFWMWVIGILGAASAYIESTLAQIYKEDIDGQYRGGPAFYFEKFFNKRFIGIIFSIFALIALGLFLPGVQSNAIAVAVNNGFFGNESSEMQSTIALIIGIVVAFILGLVIFGGIKRISKVAEIVVPVMSLIYMLMAIIILVANISHVPDTFALIFKEAFKPNALLGGVVGTAIMQGVKRGVFSSESGQGTCPHAAASAEVNHPAEQGLVQAFSVYFDTLLVCTATGLIIIITGSYQLYNETSNEVIYQASNFIGRNADTISSANFTQEALSYQFGGFGAKFIAIALFFFAFTTLMANYYTAETNITYLTGVKGSDGKYHANKLLINVVRICTLIAVIFFATREVPIAWNFAFIGVGVMAWYNVILIVIMSSTKSKPAIKALKDYENQLKTNPDSIRFSPSKLGIENVDKNVWRD